MDNLYRHVSICDPHPSDESLEEWRRVTGVIAADILRVNSPRGLFAIANDLQHMVDKRTAGDGPLGTHVARAIAGGGPGRDPREAELYGAVCGLIAVSQVLAGEGEIKRGVLGVATWSALAFGGPVPEPRLEALRQEVLARGQRKALDMASRERQRAEVPVVQTGAATVAALKKQLAAAEQASRRNAALDQEEIGLLRWLLADECVGLGRAYRTIAERETAAVAMGMELGGLLSVFPTGEHFEIGAHFVKESEPLDLDRLVEAVGGDGIKLAALCAHGNAADAWPAVFPLVRALAGRPVKGDGARIGRSLEEWWRRGLLESSAAALACKKGWS